AAWGWGCRSAGRSSTPMGAGCGQMRTDSAAPYFSSPCRALKQSSRILIRRLTGRESHAKAPCEILFIHRLTKIADDPIVQGARAVNIIGVARHEDCRNRTPCIEEVSVELDPGHRGHVDVRDQAARFIKPRGLEEIGRRRESLDGIAQRPHE